MHPYPSLPYMAYEWGSHVMYFQGTASGIHIPWAKLSPEELEDVTREKKANSGETCYIGQRTISVYS